MNIGKIAQVSILGLSATLATGTNALAGNGQGSIGSVVVGRQGHQVFVQLTNATCPGFSCGTPDLGQYQFAFSTQNPGGKDMLATVLAAKASGSLIYIVGKETCTQGATLEDVSYVIAL